MSAMLKARVRAGRRYLTSHWLPSAALALLGATSFSAHAAMTVTLSSSGTTAQIGQTVTLTATAKNGWQTVSGPMTFKDGATALPGSPVNASSGVASLTTPVFTSAGTHSYTASYTFKSFFYSTTVTSSAVSVTVNKAASSTALGPLPAATVGQPVALTAQVSGYKPGGTVTFIDMTSATSVAATLDASGKATASMTFTTGGTHTLTASYAGDANNTASSTASGAALTVAKATPSVSLVSDTVVRWTGSPSITLQATLSGSPLAGGRINFMDSFNGAAPQQVGSASLTSGNTAAVTLALSGAGLHQVSAVFPGDAANNAATSTASAVTIVATPPADAGSPADYPTRVYVDVAAPTCVPSASLTCGSADHPWRNLSDAMKTVSPGTEVIVAGREGFAYYLKDDGAAFTFSDQQLLSLPQYAKVTQDANTAPTLIRKWAGLPAPVVRGTMKLGGWQRVDGGSGQYPNLYAVDWSVKAQGLAVESPPGSGQWTFPYIVRPQQVYRGDLALEQVGGVLYNLSSYDDPTPLDNGPTPTTLKVQWPTREGERPIGRITPAATTPWLSLQANQFYFDIASHTLYAQLDSPLAAGETLEVSVQQFLLDTGYAANLTLRDLVFERSNGSAYSPQNSAVTLRGLNITADGITVREADAICVLLSGTNVTLKNSTIDHCGQMGIAAGGSGHVIDHNRVLYNNTKGFSETWAAAGIKLMADGGVTNTAVTHNEVAFNDGTGIWLDTNATQITIDGNQIGFNGRIDPNTDTAGGGVIGFGVHLEAVNDNIVTNNTIVGNANAGINLIGLSTSISGNLIAANLGPAISRPADSRLPCPSASNSNNVVQQNRFAWNDEVVPNPIDPAHPDIKQNPNFITLYRWTADASDANRYCGTSVGLSSATESVVSGACTYAGQSVYNDLPGWRSLTAQDANSTLMLTAYSTATRDQVVNRDPALWASVMDGTFAANTASACHW